MAKKARLGLYLEDEDLKQRIKIAAVREGVSTTAYCTQAIKERLEREGETTEEERKRRKAFLARVDRLRRQIGPIGARASDLIKEGRRR